MNERIQELAEQSGMTQYVAAENKYLERFAELIIEECAKFLDEKSDHDNFVAKVAPLLAKPKT